MQAAATVLMNGYAKGFAEGHVFQGASKAVCVPVLNCYSCPGALGACPIGALQTVEGSARHTVSFYVLGTLMLFGVVLGRLACGFLCPFGLVQDLVHRIPTPKAELPPRVDSLLRKLKYVVLAVLVVLLPMFATGGKGVAKPFFCEFVCPAGTLGASIPLLAADPALRELVGARFLWKAAVLVAVLLAAVLVRRPFCRYLCPLGALYGLFNPVSLFQVRLDEGACTDCGTCTKACPMGLDPRHDLSSPECIRCTDCKAACPAGAITSGFEIRTRKMLADMKASAVEGGETQGSSRQGG